MLEKSNCPFCDARNRNDIGNTEDFLFTLSGENVRTRLLRETANFAVMPSIGQIVEGYLLLLPKAHVLSIAQVPRQDDRELVSLYAETKEVLRNAYSTSIVFEHGAAGPALRAGCCVDHAHLHFVPVNVDLSPDLREAFPEFRISSLLEIRALFEKPREYLYFETNDDRKYVYAVHDIPPQYLRRLVARKLGVEDKSDWAIYRGKQELLRTISKLSEWSRFAL